MRFLLAALFICLSSQVFAADMVTSLVGRSGGSEKAETDPYMTGDLWLRVHEPERVKLDLDLQFDRNVSKVNVAQLKYLMQSTDIIAGRQQIGWGVGYTVNPVDILNPRPIGSSFDPTFVRDGRDAIVLTRYLDDSKIELASAGKYEENNTDFSNDVAGRYKMHLWGFDAAVSYINKGRRTFSGTTEEADRVWGVEIVGSLPVLEWGTWSEAAYYTEAKKYEVVVGYDYYWGDHHIVFEYYLNEFGSKDRTSYDQSLLLQGRLMAQDYLIPSWTYTVNEKLALTGFAFFNLNDGGIIGGGVVDYFINNNMEFVLMPFALKGGADTEVGIQKALVGRYGAEAMLKLVF